MKDDECLNCGLTIWYMENTRQWVHLESGQLLCPPTTIAIPKTVRLG